MQAVRGSDGTGSTVYQNTSKRPLETGVGFSEPLLAPSPTKKPAATANTRALRPWKRHNGDAEHPVNTEADGSHQLPTPVPSDPPVQAKRRSDKERGVDRSDSDDEFGALDDHGEADLVHLTKAAEQSNPDKRTREWKENMKAVEEFEDHGGALFDEAERMLLGKTATCMRASFLTDGVQTSSSQTKLDQSRSSANSFPRRSSIARLFSEQATTRLFVSAFAWARL